MPVRTGPAFAALLLVAVALAGCSDGAPKDGLSVGTGEQEGQLKALHGYVVDAAIRPLEGATVKVLDTNASTTTDGEGGYGFDDLPVEVFLVIVATKPGYLPSSKQITLAADVPVRLNFTLEPEPSKAPAMEVRSFDGILACEAAVMVSDQNQSQDCNAGAMQNKDIWEFAVGPDLAGAVVEIYWDAQNPAAESMGARLETMELGKLNAVLGDLVGTSPLRVLVPQSVASKYYTGGGLLRLSVFASPNGDEAEAGIAASVQVQQTFTAYATLCYVLPPDPSLSIANSPQSCQG